MSINDALIPLYREEMMSRPGFRFTSDDAVLCMVLNHLFETAPEKFGDANHWTLLKQVIKNYLEEQDALPGFAKQPILPYMGRLFSCLGINPLKDVRVAMLGGEDYSEGNIFSREGAAFRRLFGEFDFRDFSYRTEFLTVEKSQQIQNKFDFVVSANVLNQPGNVDIKNIFAACANILYPQGLAIHALDYSNDHYDISLNAEFHAACYQVRTDDNGMKNDHDSQGDRVDVIVLQQRFPACVPEFYLGWLEKFWADRNALSPT